MNIEFIEVLLKQEAEFNFPSGICYDPESGCFYIADMHNHRICKANPATRTMEVLPANVAFQGEIKPLDRPLALTIRNDDGTLIAADAGHNNIFRYSPPEAAWFPMITAGEETIQLPGAVTNDSAGVVYTVDFLNNRIAAIGNQGEIQIIIGGETGLRDGAFEEAKIHHPYGIFHWQNKLYFVDTENHRVRFADVRERFVGTVEPANDDVVMNRPIAITLDPAGNIYICEQRRLLCMEAGTNRLSVVLDRDIWKAVSPQFDLQERICHIGALAVPRAGEIYWLDTIKGLFYRVQIAL